VLGRTALEDTNDTKVLCRVVFVTSGFPGPSAAAETRRWRVAVQRTDRTPGVSGVTRNSGASGQISVFSHPFPFHTLSSPFPLLPSPLPSLCSPSHPFLPFHVFPPLPPPLLPCTGAPWTFLTLPTPLLRHLASRGKNVHSEISGPRSSPGEGRDRERSSLNQVKLSFVTYAGAWLRN